MFYQFLIKFHVLLQVVIPTEFYRLRTAKKMGTNILCDENNKKLNFKVRWFYTLERRYNLQQTNLGLNTYGKSCGF